MKIKRQKNKGPVVKQILRADGFTGRQVDVLRTAMIAAHTLSNN